MNIQNIRFKSYFHVNVAASQGNSGINAENIYGLIKEIKPTAERTGYTPSCDKGVSTIWLKGRDTDPSYIRFHVQDNLDFEVGRQLKAMGARFAMTNEFDSKDKQQVEYVLENWEVSKISEPFNKLDTMVH